MAGAPESCFESSCALVVVESFVVVFNELICFGNGLQLSRSFGNRCGGSKGPPGYREYVLDLLYEDV